MNHDPLCWIKNPHPNWTKCACCYQIAKIREDMLAKCIALIEESVPWSTENWIAVDERAAILAALRAFGEVNTPQQ
jgi:hypothetical protein